MKNKDKHEKESIKDKMIKCVSCNIDKLEKEFIKDNKILKSCYNCRCEYMKNKDKMVKYNTCNIDKHEEEEEFLKDKMIKCLTCNIDKLEKEFIKDNNILKSCYNCRCEYMKKIKGSFLFDINDYYYFQKKLQKLTEIDKFNGPFGSTEIFIQKCEIEEKLNKLKLKYDYIDMCYSEKSKIIINDYEIYRSKICNLVSYYKLSSVINVKGYHFWSYYEFDETVRHNSIINIKEIDKISELHFKIAFYNEYCKNKIEKMNKIIQLYHIKLPTDIIGVIKNYI